MKLTKNNTLLIIGDSITDAYRSYPESQGLGIGYVSQVNALLGSRYPELLIKVINQGVGGNTVRDLKKRWQNDVLDLKPDWLSIMIGVNDVWRQFDQPWQKEIHVLIKEYEETLDELLTHTTPHLKGLILMSPFYIEPNQQDAMRAQVDRYGAVVKRLAEKHKTIFVDTQSAFDQTLKHYYAATLSWDRVHPSQIGHMIISRAFLKSIDFEW